jgi:hypothetical protein
MSKSNFLVQSALPLCVALAIGWACKDDKENPSVTSQLGTYTTDTGGLTEPIILDVPEDATSVLLGCGPFGYDLLGTAWEIRDPSGALYYTNEFHDEHSSTKMRVGNHDDFVPILMPVSPDHNINPGKWKARIWVAAGGEPVDVSCTQVTRTAGVSGTGTVNLNLVFVGVDGIDAGNASGNTALQSALDRMESIWAEGGIAIGEVNYEDFDGDVEKFTVIDDDSSEAGQLYETVSRSNGITIFFVQEISSSSGSTIVGQAAGPPGAATLEGTSKSGMIVSAVDLADDASYVGLAMAHEGAHFLGLFHTTEKDGDRHDPIGDTEQGSSSSSNLMWWAPEAGSSANLTSDQSWVLRRNPVVR